MSESSMQHYRDKVVAVAVRQARRKSHPEWRPSPDGIYSFRVNRVAHTLCGDCIDVRWVDEASDEGIGTQAYGTCEACGFHKPSVA